MLRKSPPVNKCVEIKPQKISKVDYFKELRNDYHIDPLMALILVLTGKKSK